MLSVKCLTFNPVQENTYVLFNAQGDCCIIDPGSYFPEEREILRSFIEDSGLRPLLLLNTHCHLDHVFGNKFVYDTWGLPLHMHKNEDQMLDFAPQSGLMWQLPFDGYEGPRVYLDEGEKMAIGDDILEVLFTPGHSPGSISFYHREGGFVISGDVIFRGSIGRTDLPGGNFEALVESIRSRIFILPDETLLYSGHGPETTVGVEKRENPFVGEGAQKGFD